MTTSEDTTVKSALFVDFDNIYLGLKDIDDNAAEQFATNPGRWLHWLREGMPGTPDPDQWVAAPRSILVRRCYLNPRRFHDFRPYFIQSAFQVTDCPPLTSRGKTSTDIHMVLDVVDTLSHQTRFDEFIILSGDADFTPVLLRLRSHDRRTVVLAAGPASQAYRAACDHAVSEDLFVEHALGIAADSPDRSYSPASSHVPEDVLDDMSKALTELVHTNGEVEAIELPPLYRRFPDFTADSNWLGFWSLRNLTHELVQRSRSLQIIERGESWYVGLQEPVGDALEVTSLSTADALELRERVIAMVNELVRDSAEAVVMATAAHHVRNTLGESIISSDWAGCGTFKNLLMSSSDRAFDVVSHPIPGYVYDPARHELPDIPDPEDELAREQPDLADFAGRISRLTGTPRLTSAAFAALFRSLAEDLSASPYHLTTTSKAVRDRCIERDQRVPRSAVSYVIKGIGYSGVRFGDTPEIETPLGLAGAFLDHVRRRCEDADLPLTDPEVDRLREWILGELE